MSSSTSSTVTVMNETFSLPMQLPHQVRVVSAAFGAVVFTTVVEVVSRVVTSPMGVVEGSVGLMVGGTVVGPEDGTWAVVVVGPVDGATVDVDPVDGTNYTGEMDKVRDVILKDLCDEWDEGCRYIDRTRQQCEFETWLKYMNDPSQCGTTPPPPNGTCPNTSKCDQECDRRWPWSQTPDCTGKCGIGFNRSMSTPPLMMENCAREFWCPTCQPSAAITTTTMETKEGEPKDMTWLYILLAIFGLLILIGIIAGVVISKKRAAGAKAASVKAVLSKKINDVNVDWETSQSGDDGGKGAEASVDADLPSIAQSTSKIGTGGKTKQSGKESPSIKDASKASGPSKSTIKSAGSMMNISKTAGSTKKK